jgi:hypothetical protein
VRVTLVPGAFVTYNGRRCVMVAVGVTAAGLPYVEVLAAVD